MSVVRGRRRAGSRTTCRWFADDVSVVRGHCVGGSRTTSRGPAAVRLCARVTWRSPVSGGRGDAQTRRARCCVRRCADDIPRARLGRAARRPPDTQVCAEGRGGRRSREPDPPRPSGRAASARRGPPRRRPSGRAASVRRGPRGAGPPGARRPCGDGPAAQGLRARGVRAARALMSARWVRARPCGVRALELLNAGPWRGRHVRRGSRGHVVVYMSEQTGCARRGGVGPAPRAAGSLVL